MAASAAISHRGPALANAPEPRADWQQGALFLGLVAILVAAPLPLASNRPWALGMLAMAIWALLSLGAIYWTLHRGELAARLAAGGWAVACLTGFCMLVAAQLPELAPEMRRWFVGTTTSGGPLSLDPASTRLYLLTAATHLGGFLATLLLVHERRHLLGLAAALVVSGLVQSIVGVGRLAYGDTYVYLGEDFAPDRALGTFANSDHLANYLALCLSLGLGLLLARFELQAPARNRYERWVRLLDFMLSTKMLLRLMLIVMVIALVLTRSRMGNLAFFTSLLVVCSMLAWRSPQLRRGALWLVASLLVVDLLVVGEWVGLDRVVQRLEQTSVTDARKKASDSEETFEQRQAGALDALAMVRERPLSGFGGGTFYTAFPLFKGPKAYGGRYDHTHNDYVEIAADTGLVGLSLLAAVVLLAARRIAQLMRDEEPRHHRGLATGLAMALSVMLMHSLVDFPLQIPANALTFSVLLATAFCMRPRQPAKDRVPVRAVRRPATSPPED